MRLVLLGLFFILQVRLGFSQEYLVIANEIGSRSLSTTELKLVFKPKNNFWTNRKSVLIVLPGNQSPIKDAVARDMYAASFVAMQKYWLSLVFQGRFAAPVNLNSDEETINFIRKNPGAIGFITTSGNPPPELLIQITN